MATNPFPKASRYADIKRKLLYERKGAGGTIQIWKEGDKYKQVLLLNDGNFSAYNCQKKGRKIKCGSLIFDLETKKEAVTPINVKKEALKQLPVTDRVLLKGEETLREVKKSYSGMFIKPFIKWALIGAGAYLLFLFLQKANRG